MTRLAKATSAFTFGRSASGAAGHDARSFATRVASRGGNGSGAPAGRTNSFGARLALVALAVAASAMALAPTAFAAPKGVAGFFGNPSTASSTLAGQFSLTPAGIAVNTTGAGPADPGDVYVVDQGHNRIQRFNSLGEFELMWGRDVVQPGGLGEAGVPISERQSVALADEFNFGVVTGGTFTLTFNSQTTNPIPFNASAAVVDQHLEDDLSNIGAGDVAVTGGPGPGTAWSVDFTGALAFTDVPEMTGNGSGLTTSIALPGVVKVTTAVPGGVTPTAEICTVAAQCKEGLTGGLGGELAAPAGIVVDQVSGNVFIVERNLPSTNGARVQAFTGDGQFLWTNGRDAIKPSPTVNTDLGDVFEVCTHALDCQSPAAGVKGGEFGVGGGTTALGISVVPAGAPNAGNVFVTDRGNLRMQEFTSAGAFVRAFGADVVPKGGAGNVATNEQQTVTVGASGGTFKLTFSSQTTVALPYNAPATDPGTPGVFDSVEEALNNLTSIKPSGSVSVTDGPGDTTGASPYKITFGGSLADTDVAQISVDSAALQPGPGRTLTCTGGPASGVTLSYQWLANGQSLGAANGAQTPSYTIQPADAGKAVQCRVTAVNAPSGNTGSTVVSSPLTVVTASGPLPTAPSSIAISGNATLGSTLTCPAGSWGNAPTSYTYQWVRNGSQVLETETKAATSDTYEISAADVASPASFQCIVAATNVNGAVAKASTNKATPSTPNPPGAPSPSAPTATATMAPLATTATAMQGASSLEICVNPAECKAGSAGANSGQFGASSPNRVAVDSAGNIYTVESGANFRLQKFAPAGPNLVPTIVNPNVGGGGPALPLTGTSGSGPSTDSPLDVAVGPSNHLFVLKGYPIGVGSPTAQVAERRVVELDSAGAYVETHASRAGISANYLALNDASEEIYLAGFVSGAKLGVFVLGASSAPTVSMGVSGISAHTAQLNGLVNPGGPDTLIGITTKYHFEYRKVGAPAWTVYAPDKDVGDGFSSVSVLASLTGLEAGTPYEAKLVASKPFSGVASIETTPLVFVTPASQPEIEAAYVTEREATTARLNARINPNGQVTTYYFEYGPTAAYGTKVPALPASAGATTTSLIFGEAISGLAPGTTYHFRVLATNGSGTAKTPDRKFTTRTLAQQSGGRAFELVSPPDKVGGTGLGTWYRGPGSHANSGVPALDGERFASTSYYGGSIVDGMYSFGGDWALGERTPTGWVNRPAFNRAGGSGASEFGMIPGIRASSADLSLMSWATANQMGLFEEQAAVWGNSIGLGLVPALRDWDTGHWEMVGPLAPNQLIPADPSIAVASDGDYALMSGGARGLAGPGDPTNVAFSGDPSDWVEGNRNVYIDDVSAGLSDTFPGAGIRSLVNACTGDGTSRTEIPGVDGAGRVVGTPCPGALPGRDSRLISPHGASSPIDTADGALSADGSRVFFLSPDPGPNANHAACTGLSPAATKCPPQLYVRQRNEDGSVTVRWISRSMVPGQDATLMSTVVFEGATPDGDKAFFRTASPLTADDPNGDVQVPGGIRTGKPAASSVDLYMYDFPDDPDTDPGEGFLTRVSAGPTGAGDANVATKANEPSVSSLRAFGENGSRVYFTTAAPLPGVPAPSSGTITSPGGTPSQEATRNLYLYDAGLPLPERWRFIAQLTVGSTFGECAAIRSNPGNGSALIAGNNGATGGTVQLDGSSSNCVRAVDDGSFVAFFTDGRLTADDPDGVTGDIYGYDAISGELTRISASQGGGGASYVCVNEGPATGSLCHADLVVGGTASGGSRRLNLTTSSTSPSERTVYFESVSQLLPEDENSVYDVYQWHSGNLSLISTGAPGADDALYRGNDRSGTNIYISTRDRLTWEDYDSVLDVYTARLDGGFPEPLDPPACDVLADGCQGSSPSAPAARGASSSVFDGSGNVVEKPKATKKCPKGKVRRGGKCVAKKGKSTQAKRTANKTRRAAK